MQSEGGVQPSVITTSNFMPHKPLYMCLKGRLMFSVHNVQRDGSALGPDATTPKGKCQNNSSSSSMWAFCRHPRKPLNQLNLPCLYDCVLQWTDKLFMGWVPASDH